jgi:hypothetical protein
MAEKATTDDAVVYTELTPEQHAKALEFTSVEPVSYEFAEHEPNWFRLIRPTPEQVTAFEAALA